MLKTFKYRIYPTKEQTKKIEQTLYLCRYLYNNALEQRITVYEKHNISLSYTKQANELKYVKQALNEYRSIHSQVLQDVLKRLDRSFQNFFRRLNTNEKPGFPRFQGKNRYNSFTYPQSGFSLKDNKIKLSKIGNIRMNLHRKLSGELKTCTIMHKNNRYYVALVCEVENPKIRFTDKAVGIDLGISHLAITSDGEFYNNPKYLRKSDRQLKRLQRIVSKRKKGSHRRRKAVQLLAKKHEQIANQRKDTNHKVSRKLINEYDLIVFEDLNIKGMVKNKHLAKNIHEVSWNQLINFTMYKAENAGKKVKLVNPHNTSQQCSSCGEIVKKTLAQRKHICSCGYTAHRDINASINILHRGLSA